MAFVWKIQEVQRLWCIGWWHEHLSLRIDVSGISSCVTKLPAESIWKALDSWLHPQGQWQGPGVEPFQWKPLSIIGLFSRYWIHVNPGISRRCWELPASHDNFRWLFATERVNFRDVLNCLQGVQEFRNTAGSRAF